MNRRRGERHVLGVGADAGLGAPVIIDGHAPPWSFAQALKCMQGGGRVRQTSDRPGYFIRLVGGVILTDDGEIWEPREVYILATNWEQAP